MKEGPQMTNLYFKRRYGTLECVKIEGEGRTVRFITDEPINASFHIGKKRAYMKAGECVLDLSELECGSYTPKLISQNGSEKMGKILLTPDSVSQIYPDFDFVRELAERLWVLECEHCTLKAEYEKLKERIYKTSIF